MEIFRSMLKSSQRIEGDRLYMEFEPENDELKEQVSHGMTLPVSGTIAETVAGYEPNAAREMFIQVERMYPGSYQLDPQYG